MNDEYTETCNYITPVTHPHHENVYTIHSLSKMCTVFGIVSAAVTDTTMWTLICYQNNKQHSPAQDKNMQLVILEVPCKDY